MESMGQEESRAAANRTFCRLWQQFLPYLVLMKPMTNLCWVYQKNSTAVLRAVNDPESVKSSTLKAFEGHLTLVQLERSYYQTTLDQCKESNLLCLFFPRFTVPLSNVGVLQKSTVDSMLMNL